MIVNLNTEGFSIITQTHHAHLACLIAENLKEEYKKLYFSDVFAAIAFHESKETDFNYNQQLSDLGQPISFDKPEGSTAESAKKVEHILNDLVTRSLLVAALVSSHFKFLYPEVFNNKLVSPRNCNLDKDAMKLYAIPVKEYKLLYGILKFCDRLSLMICKEEFPDAKRCFEINHSLGNTLHNMLEKEGEFLIDPWPFSKKSLEIEYEYHLIKQSSFKNTEAFLKAFSESEICLKKVVFKK